MLRKCKVPLFAVLVSVVISLVLSYAVGASNISDDIDREDCSLMVDQLSKRPKLDWKEDEWYAVARIAYVVLVYNCPSDPDSLPVDVLLNFVETTTLISPSAELGVVYEHGIRVPADPERARLFYRLYHLVTPAPTADQKLSQTLYLTILHPSSLWAADVSARDRILELVDSRSLISPIFDEEQKWVTNLYNGPFDHIWVLVQHLRHGSGGYPKQPAIAGEVLFNAGENDAPDASFAFWQAIDDGWLRAEHFAGIDTQERLETFADFRLSNAAKSKHPDALIHFSKKCENSMFVNAKAVATLIYELAAEVGAQVSEEHLRRLRADWTPTDQHWYEREKARMDQGSWPICEAN